MNHQIAQSPDHQERGLAQMGTFDRMMVDSNASMNSGAVAIESQRAIAEARGQMQLAMMFPRSINKAMAEFLESCKSPDFAAEAFYTVKNRGSGPSIRFAEEAARCYGHFDYGHRELSRGDGKSEIEVFAWDKEKNNTSKRQITVLHILDVGGSSRKLTSQADIDNKIANVASKQMRGRILALLPKHMIAAGKAECLRTLAGGNDKPAAERILRLTQAFDRRGVTADQLAKYLNISKVNDMTAEQIGDLQGVFNAIKEGAKVSEYFGGESEQEQGEQDTGAAIANLHNKAASAGAEKGREKPADKATSQGVTKSSSAKQREDGSSEKSEQTKPSVTKKNAQSPAPAPPPPASDPLDNLQPEQQQDDQHEQVAGKTGDEEDVF